jgi:hypothetical protein
VTLIRIASGLHDLTLSPAPVRAELFSEMGRWIGAYAEREADPAPADPG